MSSSNVNQLQVTKFSGTAFECGKQYGSVFSTLIEGFCLQEVSPNNTNLQYAKKCLPLIERYAPLSARFMQGVAKGSKLPLDAITLLSLHEEMYHYRFSPSHCTGFISPRNQVCSRKTLVAQNWDWQPQLFPWAGLVHLTVRNAPRVLAYHYPGLWNCCGINSAGLSLMWTGGGYFPPIPPTIGVPTYVLVSEVLQKQTVEEALEYLKETPRAGAFIFLLGDRHGKTAVVEAIPTTMEVAEREKVAYRANLFHLPAIKQHSKQSRPSKKIHSTIRIKRIENYLNKTPGRITIESIKEILKSKDVQIRNKLKSMTVDQLIAVCEDRILLVRRGGGSSHRSWRKYRV